MLNPPIGPSLDPSLRVLLLPATALNEVPIPLGAVAGLPAGTMQFVEANLLMTATPCEAPLFTANLHEACFRLNRDVLLVRTGMFPETMNPVTVDVALIGPDGPLTLTNQSFLRHRDGSLWVVPQQIGPFIEIRSDGLALQTTPPFVTWSERCDGLCRAAAEIVRIVSRRRGR